MLVRRQVPKPLEGWFIGKIAKIDQVDTNDLSHASPVRLKIDGFSKGHPVPSAAFPKAFRMALFYYSLGCTAAKPRPLDLR